jgi:hypothetical protein
MGDETGRPTIADCDAVSLKSPRVSLWFSGQERSSGSGAQLFGARSQVSVVDADWLLFEKSDAFKCELKLPPDPARRECRASFFIDPRMTHDQWVLIMVCAWVATLFAAILLFVPS